MTPAQPVRAPCPLAESAIRRRQPPARRYVGPGTTGADRRHGPTRRIFCGEGASSANNPWCSRALVRKSLIVERTSATSHRAFAINHEFFAMSLLFAPSAAKSLSLLPISLKKKKKENEEGREVGRIATPLVRAVSPSVEDPAYFLGHGCGSAPTRQ